jgi:hypothetical protein
MDEEKRPIATAPRDGTKIRLWCDDQAWRVGSFAGGDRFEIGNGAGRVIGAAEVNPDTLTATHWKPIENKEKRDYE